MIPQRLQLRNFLCYRDPGQALDFSGIHLACLTGPNGHGKSALLDAMTWALWGKARSSHDNDLITLGQEEMEVEFDFTLAGNRYRIIRKRSSRGRGQSSLEFQVKHDDRFNPLTEPTVRQTQARIDSLLRMDYETFINSAFLLQGRADEFTTKPPAERKRILGEILGLSIYDVYEQRAKEKGKEAEINEREGQARLQEIDRELEYEPRYEAERRQAADLVAQLGQELKEIEGIVDRLRQEKRTLDLQRKQWEELSARIARMERELQEVAQQLATRQERVSHFEAVIAHREEIETGYAAWQEAKAADAKMNAKLSQLVRLNEEKSRLEQRITEAKVQLESQKRFYTDKLAELQAKSASIERLQVSLAEARRKLNTLAEQETVREEKRQAIQALSNKSATLQALNQRLREDMEALQEKITLLQGAEAKCPLCGSALSGEHRASIIADMEAEGKQKGDQFRNNRSRLSEIKESIAALEGECQHIERALQTRSGLQREEAALERSLSDAETAREEQATIQEALAATEGQLTAGEYATETRAELALLEAQVAELGYDAAAHEAIRQRVEQHSAFEKARQELDLAHRLLEDERGVCQQLAKTQARWQESLQQDQERLKELADALSGAGEVERRLQEAMERLQATRDQESRARLSLGAAQQKLEYCNTLKVERERQRQRLRQLAAEKSVYRDLQTAFGQKGLRAMLIESAIPEIEEEANRLLARMTDNRMHVRFETQRETQKGDTVETLDIRIADELGTRNYEMYSGGEAFRANFAIRIALSRLLARRAGAQLQTLIIDEGFGTQDAQGRERLVEAINSIKDDFECILVITHIEELQDAFPVRINVFKTAEGSRFEII